MLYKQSLKISKGLQTIGGFLEFLEIQCQSLQALVLKEKSPSDKQAPSKAAGSHNHSVISMCHL